MKNHSEIARQYALDITEGRILAAKEVIQACARHLDDLERQNIETFPYWFSEEAGNRVCRFAEIFEIFEGPKAGQRVELMPWQCFLYVSLFGWLKQGSDRLRRFRRAYVCMPRGNSKSTTSAFLLLYMLAWDGEGAAQCITAGATKKVAEIAYKAAKNFAQSKPSLMAKKGIKVNSLALKHPSSNSELWASPALVKAMDGKNVHFCVFDELHSLKDVEIYHSLKTALSKRDNNLFLMITTAGTDTSTICYEQHQFIQGILDKSYSEPSVETTFGIIYHLPEGYDWRDPVAHAAANPGYGVMVMPDMLAAECAQAKLTPGAANNFKIKYICEWCSAGGAWMDMEKWNASRDCDMRIEDFEDDPLIIGLDLATRVDLSAKVYLFTREIEGVKHYYAFTKCYLPEDAVRNAKNAKYPAWEIEGKLTVHEGNVTSLITIEQELKDDAKKFALKEIAYDPHKASQMAEGLMNANLPLHEVRQNVMNLSEPMKHFQALVYEKRFHHNCPIFDWNVGNVFVEEDRNANIYPRKQRADNKIDLVFATLNALARDMFYEDNISVYETQDILFV